MGYDAEQEVHWLELASAADPAGHGVHGTDPPGDAVPAVQGWQPLAAHVNGPLPAGQLVLAPVQPMEQRSCQQLRPQCTAARRYQWCTAGALRFGTKPDEGSGTSTSTHQYCR